MKEIDRRVEEAEDEARRRGIDRKVRLVARSGLDTDGSRINYLAEHRRDGDVLRVKATFGAGTNTASAEWNGTSVYEGHRYGEAITTYRSGRWVELLNGWVEQVEAAEIARRLLQEVGEEARRGRRFRPLDD